MGIFSDTTQINQVKTPYNLLSSSQNNNTNQGVITRSKSRQVSNAAI